MRLLQKINRNYLISSAVVLLAGLAIFYFLINRIASQEILEGLYASETRIVHELGKNETVPHLYPLIEVKATRENGPAYIKDTTIFDPMEKEDEVFKELNTFRNINGQNYHIIIRALAVEKKDIVTSIFLSIAVIFLLLVGTLYFINKKTTAKVWHPFYRNLALLKNFSLKENRQVSLHQTGITEFDELNKVISALTEKVRADYRSLKEFTENASHEIQTPLSVILMNLEEILQQNLAKKELTKIYQAYEAARRLSTLNSHLLLLTKIENGQFEAGNTTLNDVISLRLKAFQPLIKSAGLHIALTIEQVFQVKMHEALAEILMNNLISNAIKHNIKGGEIRITLSENRLEICNTGIYEPLDEKEIFNRFIKKGSQGLGLGLAIVKRICDMHHLSVVYAFSDSMHCFTVYRAAKPK
jgi:signal transduction histidine kinase